MSNEQTILNNPIWSALVSDNANLGSGTDAVRVFDGEIAPFAGLKTDTLENFQTLFDLVEEERVVVHFSPKLDLDTSTFESIDPIPGYQMLFEGELSEADLDDDCLTLKEKDVPAMLELTSLAQPGPFLKRTIAFGGYRGIFNEGNLVAMGGQRLKSNGYTEISAICSHPDHNGKGYGRRIMYAVIRDIMAVGNVPYLHVRADNTRAVALYKRLGFVICRDMNFYVLKKTGVVNLK